MQESAANLITNLFAFPVNSPPLLDGDAVGRLLRAMDANLTSAKVHLAVLIALHNISTIPLGRARVLANQGLLRIFRSMDLHAEVWNGGCDEPILLAPCFLKCRQWQ